MQTILTVDHISKSYGRHRAVHELSLSLRDGAIGCLLGSSGCGKTTVLRAIAGFETLDGGRIMMGDSVISSRGEWLPPERRRIGMVFQDYALFPHLSVADNVAFGLKKLGGKEKKRRIEALLELVGLRKASQKFPHEISGGQQQRVALVRALAPRPQLLLMDEPFSNLDVMLRERLSMEVRDILKEYGMSAIMVTHNQNEAFAMADEIGVMHEGALLQWDTAHNLYHRPRTPVVADFIGEGVLLPGRVAGARRVETGLGLLEGDFVFACRGDCPVNVLIRPEDVLLDANAPLKAEILQRHFRGASILYNLRLPSGDNVLALVSSHHEYGVGQRVGIVARVDDIILFKR